MVRSSDRDEAALLHYREFDEFGKYSRFRMVTLTRIVRYLVRHKGHFLVALLCMVVATLLSLVAPYLLGKFVDVALLGKSKSSIPLFVMIWFGVEGLRLFASMLENYFFAYLGHKVLHDLRVELYAHILRLPLVRLAEYSSGKLLARVLGDTNALAQMFTAGVIRIVEKGAVILCIIISLFILNWSLALSTLFVFPLLAAISFVLSISIYRFQRKSRLLFAGVTSFVAEAISGKKVVASFNIKDTLKRRFLSLNQDLARSQFIPSLLAGVFHGALSILIGLSVAILLIVGGDRVQQGELAVGDLVTFVTYLIWMFWPLLHMVNQWSTIVTGLASAERLFEVLDWDAEMVTETPRPYSTKKGNIRFENVWFAYSGDEWVLKNLSFEIKDGEKTGIVGSTGSGKSTVIALLLRFYKPQRGTIYLNDIDIQIWDLDELRHSIGIVEQTGALFEGTVQQNLSLGHKESESVNEFIEQRKPGFLHRQVEPGGKNLSSGERQLAAFARILARSPDVWILDEATAHVDAELDKELNGLAFSYSHGKSLLVIAHRLSSVVEMDRILVLRDGRITESGSHLELNALGGVYSGLWQTQNRTWR